MSGAWEIQQGRQVLVGILHVDLVTVAWALGLRNLQVPGAILPVSGMPYDHSRNTICKVALENGFQYVFMLDSDCIPPNDAILRLMAHRLPLVSGLYSRRSPPHAIPVAMKNGQWLTEYTPNSLVEVDVVGSGCMLIHRSLLENMPPQRDGKHWFDWRVDLQGHLPREKCLSEDFTFCQAARESLGIKTYLDTSVVCRHVGNFQVTHGSVVPLETNPIT